MQFASSASVPQDWMNQRACPAKSSATFGALKSHLLTRLSWNGSSSPSLSFTNSGVSAACPHSTARWISYSNAHRPLPGNVIDFLVWVADPAEVGADFPSQRHSPPAVALG